MEKKTMRKTITAVAVLALSGTLAFAFAATGEQGFGGHHHRHHGFNFARKMGEKLNLSDAQKAQIKGIQKSTREANAAFFDQARATRKDFWAAKKANDTAKMDALKPAIESQRAQMKELRKAEMTKITSILTPDQQAQLQQMRAERKSHHDDQQ
jgi:Spy/CpxP family protein refolding chaperone